MRHVACTEERRSGLQDSVGKPNRKRSLETTKHRWENNVTMDHKEISWEGVDWIDLAEDRESGRLL
jgi:hypothetical protein